MYKAWFFKKLNSKLQLCNSHRCKHCFRLIPSVVLQQESPQLLAHMFLYGHMATYMLTCEERLGESGLFNLEERRLQETLLQPFST